MTYTIFNVHDKIGPGSILKAKRPSKGLRSKTNGSYRYTYNTVPEQGLEVRDVKRTFNKTNGGCIGYEVYFVDYPDSLYLMHSDIDFNNSKLVHDITDLLSHEHKTTEKKIESIRDSIAELRKELETKIESLTVINKKSEIFKILVEFFGKSNGIELAHLSIIETLLEGKELTQENVVGSYETAYKIHKAL